VPGTSPPAPAFVDIVIEVVHFLSLSVPAAIGMTIAAYAIPESRGGLVSKTVRRLALPTAVFVAACAVAQYVVAPTVVELVVTLVVAAGLAVLWRLGSRALAAAVTAVALVGVLIPLVPSTVTSLDSLARSVLTAVHVLAATFWVGGLVVLAAAGILGRRSGPDAAAAETAGRDWAQTWERFSIVALYAVGGLIVSGTWLAWSHVGTPAQFLTTAYGRALGIKLLLVAALLVAGTYNMRVLLPRIRAAQHDGDARSVIRLAVEHFPVVVAAESLVSVAILAVVPFLRGSARKEAGWPAAGPFDATVFGTGTVLVGLVALALWAGTRRTRFVPRGHGQYEVHGRVR
jgi:putative copper export protein